MHHSLWGDGRPCLLTGEPSASVVLSTSFSQHHSLFPGSLALKAPMIGMHCERRSINL